MNEFVKIALCDGGIIKPILISPNDLEGPSLTNPSVIVFQNKILVNVRNVNYTLYHSELNRFEHMWGPLSYAHPENDMHLRTTNFIVELDSDLDVLYYSKVNTAKFDTYEPQWDFVGLEDVRLVEWNNRLYGIGVRRDVDKIGTGRMEMSEFEINDLTVTEISRFRIAGPPPDNEYCMKNCTPILDRPHHLLKWTNPTALLKFYPDSNQHSEVIETNSYIPNNNDMRGGSQVIPYKDGYLSIIHETELYKSEQGRKNATYRHRFVVWDKDFNIIKFSNLFSFLGAKIEFCCGLAEYENDFIITFGFQDNSAYVLKVSQKLVEEFIYE